VHDFVKKDFDKIGESIIFVSELATYVVVAERKLTTPTLLKPVQMNLRAFAELPALNSTVVLVDLPNVTTRAFAAGIRRPNWFCILKRARSLFGAVEGLVFVNETKLRPSFFAFARKLQSASWLVRYCSRPLKGFDQRDPVDSAIQAEIDEFAARPSIGKGLILMSHDGGFAPHVVKCLKRDVPVTIAGFGELLSPRLLALKEHGARIADLEYDFTSHASSGARPSAQTLARMGLRLAA
jgi:hypothetical protein